MQRIPFSLFLLDFSAICHWDHSPFLLRHGPPLLSATRSLFRSFSVFLKLIYSSFTVLYWFWVYSTMIQYFYRLYSINSYKIMAVIRWAIDYCCLYVSCIVVCVSCSHTPNLPLPSFLSSLVTTSLFSVSMSLLMCIFIHIVYVLHVNNIIQSLLLFDISPSLIFTKSTMLPQMAEFHSSLRLSNLPLCIYTTLSLVIPLLMGTWVAFISWLL